MFEQMSRRSSWFLANFMIDRFCSKFECFWIEMERLKPWKAVLKWKRHFPHIFSSVFQCTWAQFSYRRNEDDKSKIKKKTEIDKDKSQTGSKIYLLLIRFFFCILDVAHMPSIYGEWTRFCLSLVPPVPFYMKSTGNTHTHLTKIFSVLLIPSPMH